MKTWLERRLTKISDAEAPILAEYCIALLKHEQSEDEVRKMCVEQLSDFLRGDTKAFVDDVFEAIKARTFAKAGSLSSKLPAAKVQRTQKLPTAEPSTKSAIAQVAPPVTIPPADNTPFPPMPMPPPEMMMDPNFLRFMQQAQQPTNKKRKHCFAFAEKGYCHKGASCPFEHVVPLPERNHHEYDPNFSAMGNGIPAMTVTPPLVRNSYQLQQQTAGRGQTVTGDKAKSTLVVENIPQERLDELSVRQFFQTFGVIEHIQVDASAMQATVTYTNWAAANAAHTSPAPIFDNRFVKLFWQKSKNSKSKPQKRPAVSTDSVMTDSASTDVALDLADLEEKQREHDERAAKRIAMQERAKALARQRDELQRRQEEQRSIMRDLTSRDNGAITPATQVSDQRSALELQLEALKAKAAALGLTPEDLRGSPVAERSSICGGRGNSTYRGQGRVRGLGRGRGSVGASPYVTDRPRTLDLRPRTIQISNTAMPASEVEAHIRAKTEYALVRVEGDRSLQVTFKTRRDAELFSASKQVVGNMSWVRDVPVQASTLHTAAGTSSTSPSHDEEMGHGNDDDDDDRDRYDD